MSQPDFVPERGEIWYSDGTSGFYVLKVSPDVWPFRSSARPPDREEPNEPGDGDSPNDDSPRDVPDGEPRGTDPGEGQGEQEGVAEETVSDADDGGLPFTGLQLALVALTGALLSLGGWAIRRGGRR
jgi:hypothetical protein